VEVRYIILYPADIAEILFSTPIIRSIVKSVEQAEVFAAVPEQLQWVLENNPYVDSQLLYEKNPSKSINNFRDLNADYLIDLTGGKQTRWFKNRLRVMDFSLSHKILRQIRNMTSRQDARDSYRQAGLELLKVFDLADEGKSLDYYYAHDNQFLERALPESFLDNYGILDLPLHDPDKKDIAEPISDLISRIDRPLVLCGSEKWRLTGEEIMRRTGCTVLSTCGDFSDKEQVVLRSGARVLIDVEKSSEIWPMVFEKPHFFVDLSAPNESWKEKVENIHQFLKET